MLLLRSIASRLRLMVISTLLMIALMTGLSVAALDYLARSSADALNAQLQRLTAVSTLREAQLQIIRASWEVFQYHDDINIEYQNEWSRMLQEQQRRWTAAQAARDTLNELQSQTDDFAEVIATFDSWGQAVRPIEESLQALIAASPGTPPMPLLLRYQSALQASAPVRDQFEALIGPLIQNEASRARQQEQYLSRIRQQALMALLAFGVLMAALATSLSVVVLRRLGSGMTQARSQLHRTASELDLRSLPLTQRNDEFGQMLKDLEHLTRSMATALLRVQQIAQQVSTQAERTDDRARAISDEAHEEETAMHRVADRVQQLSVGLSSMAESARELGVLSETASSRARNSQTRLESVVEIMDQIHVAAGQTQQSIGLLDESAVSIRTIADSITALASQTNLLALNAAIEAARAGEQGRGFSVVADEVRKLSEHTALASAQIRETTSRIQTQTSSAVGQASMMAATVVKGREQSMSATDELLDLMEQVIGLAAAVGRISEGISQQDLLGKAIAREVEASRCRAVATRESASQLQEEAQAQRGCSRALITEIEQFKLA